MMKLEPCALTGAQEKLWGETRVALLWHCPAFSHIFYTMLNNAGSKHVAMFSRDIPVAATDGSNLILNPDVFFGFNLQERIFIVAHEILHCVFNHLILMHGWQRRGKVVYADTGKELPYEHEIMNVALDLVINDTLVEASKDQHGPKWAMPQKDGQQFGCWDPKVGTSKESGVDVYRKLFKNNPSMGGQGGMGMGQGFDQHLAPGTSQGKDPGQASQDRNDNEWRTAIAAAANAARVQGKLPAGLDRIFTDILDPQVDWTDKIEALFARKVGTGSFDWRSPDKRLLVRDRIGLDSIYAPGRSGFGADTVIVGADTSGSIGDREVAMFFAEVGGILQDIRPKRVFVIWCDAEVHRVDEVEDMEDLIGIKKKGAPGGGGTSFIPVFDWITSQGITPDALVYLTDGYGSFPSDKPKFPVIWGNISKPGSVAYPFGDVVDIPT